MESTRKPMENQMSVLHQKLLYMGSIVEEAIHKSVKSLVEQDTDLADEVIKLDKLIDSLESEIENKCFVIIALQHPVGSHLRRIGTILKLVTDLERMGDHAVGIAKVTKKLKDEHYAKPLINIPIMADLVKAMVRDSINAYITMDEELAREVAIRDDQVDQLYVTNFQDLVNIMKQNQYYVHQCAQLLFVSKFLERIADHVTNICEWIIYLKTGFFQELNT